MGGSLLSLIEIFYHFILKRLFEKREEKSTDGDEKELAKLNDEKEK